MEVVTQMVLGWERLVFERNKEIWTANADGSNQQKVDGVPKLTLLIADREPAFSPDGSLIAFFQPENGPMGDIRDRPGRFHPTVKMKSGL
jgi:hypothetical protein